MPVHAFETPMFDGFKSQQRLLEERGVPQAQIPASVAWRVALTWTDESEAMRVAEGHKHMRFFAPAAASKFIIL